MKCKGPEVKRSISSLKEKKNIKPGWESSRRDWVEGKAQFIMHFQIGLFLGTLGNIGWF